MPFDGKAEIIIAKQRNGPTDSLPLTFLKSYTRFENLAFDEYWSELGQLPPNPDKPEIPGPDLD